MLEKLEEIDEILASFEDWMHGEDGSKCTHARKLISELKASNNAKLPVIRSCPTCGHLQCMCRTPLGNFV